MTKMMASATRKKMARKKRSVEEAANVLYSNYISPALEGAKKKPSTMFLETSALRKDACPILPKSAFQAIAADYAKGDDSSLSGKEVEQIINWHTRGFSMDLYEENGEGSSRCLSQTSCAAARRTRCDPTIGPEVLSPRRIAESRVCREFSKHGKRTCGDNG